MAIDGLLSSAEDGGPEAQYRLAMLYIEGEEVPQDYAQAEKWLRMAAENDYLPAKRELGILIASGAVEGRSDTEAYDLLRGPVDRMDPRSLYYLALMYETGKCVEKDLVSAIRLFAFAANFGYPGAEEDHDRVQKVYNEERAALLGSRPLLNLQVSENGIEAVCCKDMLDFVLNGDIYFIDTYKGPAICALNEKGEEVILEKCPFCSKKCEQVAKFS
jgi:TPR repeat protein